MVHQSVLETVSGIDPAELDEWYETLDDVLHRYGPDRLKELLIHLQERAYQRGVRIPFTANTPYINSIHHEDQPPYPGNLEIERRIKSIVRWNAMAMVHGANKRTTGIGGHISTFASSATLYEVAQNHFFNARSDDHPGDMVYFQGHASPGMYARAFLEGRLTEEHLLNFRRELADGVGGLSSYPHPWLMPNFWQFPTVSMGLGPLCAIYHARFLRYMSHRGIMTDAEKARVWCFIGDGETDEPETLGAINLAVREKLDNLIFVINCNLQRLDGPVRGNGKIIQELERIFRGSGWNTLKVIWGNDWDPLLDQDENGKLVKRMGEIVDGQYQKYVVEPGDYTRNHFFGVDPELLEMVDAMDDQTLRKLRRGGHDPQKVYAAYHNAVNNVGSPTVILAKTVKGYGLGEFEGRNTTHNEKKMPDDQLHYFRQRFGIPISDDDLLKTPFYKPAEDSPEMKYLQERRKSLGGYVPSRQVKGETLAIPALDSKTFSRSTEGSGDRVASTTAAFGALILSLCRDKEIGERIVPIIPDEARTFGMEGLFKAVGIYAHTGQLYEPADSEMGKKFTPYVEAKDGQLLEEGINEAGAMGSFIAAGSAYANLGVNMMPFYIYYSMFGFQRIGDLAWCAGDTRCKGFLVGGTSGRTTLNGEGLQHEDGHSQLVVTTIPCCYAYDPAYGYELATIIQDGMRRMYAEGEEIFYYVSVYNEDYVQPAMPDGCADGIIRGMYKLKSTDGSNKKRPQLFGSGTILREALRAQEILAEKFGIGSDVWSVTSYSELRREAQAAERWNRLNPTETPKTSYLQETLKGIDGPFVATSDNVRLVPDQIRQWIPGDYYVMGTDGFGRSETRPDLRRHFEIDGECTALAAISGLANSGEFDSARLTEVIKTLDIDPAKADAVMA